MHKISKLLLFCFVFLNLNLMAQEYFTCDAYDLVNHLRFDIMAKYIYAKSRELGIKSSWPIEVYSQHLKVWGNFIEYGGKDKPPQKIGLDAYLKDFHEILDTVKSTGFDSSKSIVPVGYKSISNGSHRVAACLLYNKPVYCRNVKFKGVEATADFFKNRKKFVKDGLEEKYLDAMALQYCELKKMSTVVLFFNCERIEDFKKILKTYGYVVYGKRVLLGQNGLKNLGIILQVQNSDSAIKNDFYKFNKTLDCKKNYDIAIFLLDLELNRNTKKISNFFNNKKSCALDRFKQNFYITNSQSEALILAQTFFVKNSLDVINLLDSVSIKSLDFFANKCKKIVKTQKLNQDMTCFFYDKFDLDNSIPDALNKIKFLCHKELDCVGDEIIFNPQKFFYFRGLKFAVQDICEKNKFKTR